MECTDESCKMETHATCACGSGKSYHDCCGCQTMDPIEISMRMWHKSFFQAMHEAQVERLKKRIESAFGPTMDKAADAAIESFGKIQSCRKYILKQAGGSKLIPHNPTSYFSFFKKLS
ncbi:MAG: hypothetical protein AUI92_05760 [Thaumarchaeota archaeon 13_1_40CM_3_38_6]|nr:MAG: hypothetical protein AUI92_05760 [Thaumarchaeota archaeon 13_1_40CM_3_38_6]